MPSKTTHGKQTFTGFGEDLAAWTDADYITFHKAGGSVTGTMGLWYGNFLAGSGIGNSSQVAVKIMGTEHAKNESDMSHMEEHHMMEMKDSKMMEHEPMMDDHVLNQVGKALNLDENDTKAAATLMMFIQDMMSMDMGASTTVASLSAIALAITAATF